MRTRKTGIKLIPRPRAIRTGRVCSLDCDDRLRMPGSAWTGLYSKEGDWPSPSTRRTTLPLVLAEQAERRHGVVADEADFRAGEQIASRPRPFVWQAITRRAM